MDKPLKIAALLLISVMTRAQIILPGITNVQSGAAAVPIARINESTCLSASGNGCTTTAASMSGANLCVAYGALANSSSTPTASVSDSSSNLWYGPFLWYSSGSSISGSPFPEVVWYAPNATTTASQTFTLTTSGTFPSFTAACWSGVNASSPLDQYAGGNTTSALSVTLGSLTPTANNELITVGQVMGGSAANTEIPTINQSFNTIAAAKVASGSEGYGTFDLIQTTAAAVNPTITYAPSTNQAAAAFGASFLQATTNTEIDAFLPFEASTTGTTITLALLAASLSTSGPNNGGVGLFSTTGAVGTETFLNACQSPAALTNKFIGGTAKNDSSGILGAAYASATGNPSIGWKYTWPGPTPNTMTLAWWNWPGIAASDTGTFYSMGGPNNSAGDFISLMHHNGQIYAETALNPNGSEDSGSFFTWQHDTSTTTQTPATGSLTFTTAASDGFAVGTWLEITNTLALANAMLCQVTSDSGTTLVVNCAKAYGSTSESSWIIIPWYYVSEQFVGYKVATTGTSVCTPALVACTVTTAASLGLAANTAVSFFDGTTNGVSGIVTSDTGTALVINVINAYGTGTLTSGNVSTSAHTLKIYSSTGSLVSTQQKISNPAETGSPFRFGMGFGGDNGIAGNTICHDGVSAQWIGAPEVIAP